MLKSRRIRQSGQYKSSIAGQRSSRLTTSTAKNGGRNDHKPGRSARTKLLKRARSAKAAPLAKVDGRETLVSIDNADGLLIGFCPVNQLQLNPIVASEGVDHRRKTYAQWTGYCLKFCSPFAATERHSPH